MSIFDQAWQIVACLPFDRSQAYFHGDQDDNAIGCAWKRAKKRASSPTAKPPIDWWDIIEAGERIEGRNLERVKELLAL